PGRGESHEQGHRAWYAYSAGCQLSPPGGLGSDHPTLDLINKAYSNIKFQLVIRYAFKLHANNFK
ncbi:hypothetical protein V5066_25615, partial [Escherichia coli]|uniref:hypothetical protein n=1 Tax=Escherichia coli TaxID=562 RepID=UPI0030761FBC